MIDYSIQPYSGTDILAMVMAASAALCLIIRVRDKEAGMGWFACGLALMAFWVANNDSHLPTGPEINPSWWYFVSCLAQSSLVIGLVSTFDVPPVLRRRALALGLVFPAIFALIVLWVISSGATVLRHWLLLTLALGFVAMSLIVVWSAMRQKTPGAMWLAGAFMTVPIVAVGLGIFGIDPVAIRYWSNLPAALVGLALPSVSLYRHRLSLKAEIERRVRAESELADLNHTLEEKIHQRTKDLQDVVAGLESFNRSVSHDLHGPLSGISSLANLADTALKRGDPDKALFALPLIAEESANLRSLVTSLLDLARVADSKLDLHEIDVAQVAQEIVDQFRLSSKRKLPQIVVRSLPTLYTDSGLLRAVLTNLIGNAIKFTPDETNGHVEIGGTAANGEFSLYVSDNGIGFDSDKADDLFEPFYRLNVSGYDGNGIGLSIVGRAVERLGGRVWAESQPGQGAKFSVSLPVAA